jgi:acyl-CoA reductase-like NAD-dependent aldehyde dehydrogenase
VSCASPTDIQNAMEIAVNSQPELNKMPSYQRKEILLSIADQIKKNLEEISIILVAETGKTITDARGEVGR